MKISKESKVGVLVAIAIAILAIGYNFMKGEDIFTSSNEYYGKYKKIEGLFKSNPVLINGYKVGSVSSVQMSNETLELTVGVIVSEDIKIPKNSIMKIVNNDMIGSKAVEIIFGDSKEVAKNGDFFTAQQDQGIAQAVSGVLTPITQSVNSVLGNMDTAIAGVDLRGTLRDASLALRSFKETADKLNKLLDGKDAQITNILNDVEKTTSGFGGLTPKIDTILLELDKTAKDLNQIEFNQLASQINTLSEELSKTTVAINQKDGSLGMLVHDKSLYDNLDSSLSQLKSLLKDIEKYPRRYTGVTERQRRKGNRLKEK
ncbi:MAG: MlaD family protein [Bacteroidia bacterium]|nr:MlaD family protein [Bacteroidia bacterium]MDG2042254.1 MlaD family protein [Bacteroidia bacterium]|tara:strand:- start:7832 stop:8779 length:948 start_codon:yes stop_codon:yes gene_type:complete